MYDEDIKPRRVLISGPYGILKSRCGYTEELTSDVLANTHAALVHARDEGIINEVDYIAADVVIQSLKWEQYTP